MAKRNFPSTKYAMVISFSEAQLRHLRESIPPRKRNAAIRRALVEAGLIPAAESAQTKTPVVA